eukprot:jgi/Galph1/3535/GphlegSOOS_G2200.1
MEDIEISENLPMTKERRNELDELIGFEENEQTEDCVFLALFYAEKAGFSRYSSLDNEILCGTFQEEDLENMYNTLSLLSQMEADILILPTNTKERLSNFLKLYQANVDEHQKSVQEQDTIDGTIKQVIPFKVNFLSSSHFSVKQAKSNLETVSILGTMEAASIEAKMAYLGLLDENLPASVLQSLAGLLTYILKNGVVHTYKGVLDINKISLITLNDFLRIDYSSFKAFQIFHPEPHPKMMGDGQSKEGLSVFNIIDKTSSIQGRRLLRSWLLQPLRNLEIIQFRQNVVDYLVNKTSIELLREVSLHLRGVRNVPKIISRISNYCSSIVDWSNLRRSAKSCLSIFELIRDSNLARDVLIQQVLNIFTKTSVYEGLRNIVSWIDSVINFKESKNQGRIYINDGYSEELDNARRIYSTLEEQLTVIGTREIERLRSMGINLPWIKVTYVPRLGYLVATGRINSSETEVSTLNTVSSGTYKYPKDMELVFSTADTTYYKTTTMRELDEQLGDIFALILELENEVLHQLESNVIPLFSVLYETSKHTAQLDCFISLALTAIQNKWTRPMLTAERGYSIKCGRHPLYELNSSIEFVANDTVSNGGDMHIITGPNYSGKSVYLKQIALLVYLAHIGSFIPVKDATIGVTDQILTRIQTEDSISLHLSSFFLDCTQVAMILRVCTSRSLLIIDEFGKGTQAGDGMAILAATLLTLLDKKENMPSVFCSTHMYDILTSGIISSEENDRVHVMSMECLFEDDLSLQKKIIPLYRVVPGLLATESYAVQCAARVGVPIQVLQRAIEIQTCIQQGKQLTMRNEKYLQKLSRMRLIAKEFLESNFSAGSDVDDNWFSEWDL